jgi:acyl dehydratase
MLPMNDATPPTLGSEVVGTRFELPVREIGWRETTNYAAAVGDLNPRYFDDTKYTPLIAPPMFVAAVTWPVHSAQLPSSPDSLIPEDVSVTGVHASYHLVLRRPIRVGDRITVSGRLASIRPTRAGVLTITHLDLMDSEDQVVVTEVHGTMYRGAGCSDGGRSVETTPTVPDFTAPYEPLRDVSIPIARELPYVYDGCSEIISAIHTSPAFARDRAGLPDIILQGTCSLALAAKDIVNVEAEGDPARLEALACRFSDFVIPGTIARLQILRTTEVEGGMDVFFHLLNAEGEAALTRGYARIAA